MKKSPLCTHSPFLVLFRQSHAAGPCWHAASGTVKNGNNRESVCSGTFDGQHLSLWCDHGQQLSASRVFSVQMCADSCGFAVTFAKRSVSFTAHRLWSFDIFFYLFMEVNNSAILGGLDDHILIIDIRWQPHASRVPTSQQLWKAFAWLNSFVYALGPQ